MSYVYFEWQVDVYIALYIVVRLCNFGCETLYQMLDLQEQLGVQVLSLLREHYGTLIKFRSI